MKPSGGNAGAEATPAWATRLLWVALPACGSLLLLAVTNQMCQDVAVVPFLWVLPLSLYLLSFIVCFGWPALYTRPLFWSLLVGAVAAMLALVPPGAQARLAWQVAGYAGGLFVCCLVCHGELVRLRPSPRHLTGFYLATAAGGALGGFFVGIVAPAVFRTYLELHVGLFACCALAMAAFWRDVKPHRRWQRHPWMKVWGPLFAVALGVFGWMLWKQASEGMGEAIWLSRNFYGTLRVIERVEGSARLRVLEHGRIDHGWQRLDGKNRRVPMAYFAERSGVGLTLRNIPHKEPLRVGIIGLGAGVLAAYGQKGDHFTFYEINPTVERLAETYFTYLKDMKDAGGTCDVVLGDARLSLAGQAAQGFDVFAVDAFSGDAIPIHLLTREAFEIYLRHLKPDGIMALHITNRYLDLFPVVMAQARHFGLHAALIDSKAVIERGIAPSQWVLLSRSGEFLDSALIQAVQGTPPVPRRIRLWTDDYSNLFQILR